MLRKLTISLMLCLAPAFAADAKGPKWNEGESHHNRGEHDSKREPGNHRPGSAKVYVNIGTPHRSVFTNYYTSYYARGHCPPGLAKKDNGCLPPGHAKRFVIGQALPHYVVYSALPPDLALRVAAPAGYSYVYLDGHVLLMSLSTRLVVDSFAISVNIR